MAAAGDLLLASPGMHDSIFDRAVVLLLDHDDEGSMGLILNRPSAMTVSDVLPGLAAVAMPDILFLGGPVEEGTALVLAEPLDPAAPDLHFMREGVGLVDLTGSTDEPGRGLARARVFSGYAGWGPRQLETELRSGAWIPAAAVADDLWHGDSDALWAAILRRQGPLTTFLSDYPDQPWLN